MSTWKRSGGVNALTRLYKACASKPQAVQTPCSKANNCDRDAWELFGFRNLCSDAHAQSQKEPSGASDGSGFSHQGHALLSSSSSPSARARFRGRATPRSKHLSEDEARLFLSSTSSASSSNSSPDKVWRSTALKERHAATNFLTALASSSSSNPRSSADKGNSRPSPSTRTAGSKASMSRAKGAPSREEKADTRPVLADTLNA
mmetsp:Transcript_7254/g.20231  ORF Transcript_7254/g.20231 Transcript_7254/m.20231 type:complete len:204 (-) Transcript_7254:465-1076(-)